MRTDDFVVREELAEHEGLERLVWSVHVRLADRALGYLPRTANANDAAALNDSIRELLIAPPVLPDDLVNALIETSLRARPSVSVAASFAATLLLADIAHPARVELAELLVDAYWERRDQIYLLGAAASSLESMAWAPATDPEVLGGLRTTLGQFARSVLDWANYADDVRMIVVAEVDPLEKHGLVCKALGQILEMDSELCHRFGSTRRDGESLEALVSRAITTFRKREEFRKEQRRR